jgi:hypothetical protein
VSEVQWPWLKLWNEAPDDAKWLAAAEMACSSRPVVWYTFTKSLTHANQNHPRGSIAGLHPQIIASWCGVPVEEIKRIWESFRELGILVGDQFAKWAKRQAAAIGHAAAAIISKAALRQRKYRSGRKVTSAEEQRAEAARSPELPFVEPAHDRGERVTALRGEASPVTTERESEKENPPLVPPRGGAHPVAQPELLLPINGGRHGQRRETERERRRREYKEAVARTVLALGMVRGEQPACASG